MAPHLAQDGVTQPRGFVTAAIDGLVSSFFEWRGAGSIPTQPPLGAMWKADAIFTAIRFGWSHEHLYLRLDPDETSRARQPALEVDMTLQGPRDTFRVTFPLKGIALEAFTLLQLLGDRWQEIGAYRSICRKTIVELALPWKELHLEPGEDLRLSIVVREHGLEVARYPHLRPAVFTMPGPEFEAGLWRV